MSNRDSQIITIYKIVVAKVYHTTLSKEKARSIEGKVVGGGQFLMGCQEFA